MKPSHFFVEEEDPAWDLNGDPWSSSRFRSALDTALLDRLRCEPQEGVDEIEAAYALTQLAHKELLAYGTDRSQELDEEEVASVLRALRAVLRRVSISFDPPFRDFKGFHGYWSSNGMSGPGGWGERRGYLNELFSPIFSQLDDLENERAARSSFIHGVDGQLRNLIFASAGPKPEIVLRDAINNVVEVTRNAEYCLFYDRPLTDVGLTWGTLRNWWRSVAELGNESDSEVGRTLYGRLWESVKDNPVERLLFRTYCERYGTDEASTIPALLPQVYLHYDPLTWEKRGGRPGVLARERMDFLLLLPKRVRIVIEVDGKQHYAQAEFASPERYASMVAEDRRLRLRGYEVYRFGGFELSQSDASDVLRNFFDDLLEKYAD